MPKPSESSAKFIERNRAPRVHIEYELDVNGAQKKVELPFIMGVMADLSGKPAEALPEVKDRKFVDVDMDNFDAFLGSTKPRVNFSVPNVLSSKEGENIAIDITFDSMNDFSPEVIARKVEPLRKLLEVRTELENLRSYMDGKTPAEDLIAKLINDESFRKSVASAPKPKDEALDAPVAE